MTQEEEYQQALQARQSNELDLQLAKEAAQQQGQSLRGLRPMDPVPSYDLAGPYQNALSSLDARMQSLPQGPSSYDLQLQSGQDPFGIAQLPGQPNRLAGLQDPTAQGGLGIAGPGPAPDRQMSMRPEDIFARDLFGPNVDLGYWDRIRLRSNMAEGGLTQLAMNRQTQANRLAQIEESKRNHDLQMVEKLMASGNMDALIEYGKQHPDSPATLIGQSISKQHLADVATGIKDGLVPDEVIQRVLSKQATPTEIGAWANSIVEIRKANAKEQAKAFHLQKAMNTPADQRNPYQQQLVDEHQSALELKNAETDLKKAQTKKALMEAERGPVDNSTLAKIHEMIAGGQSWKQGTPETQRKALDEYAKLYPEGRTAVQMGTPMRTQDRVNLVDRNEFLKHDKIVNPPPGVAEGAGRTGNYVEMTDKQREDWGNLVNSGATLQTLFDEVEPLVTADTPMKAAKQFARLHLEAATKKNPKAATYLADSEAFSSRMARVFGSEVGVLTNPDVTRWQRALPTFGDTRQVLEEKKRIFTGIYKQTKEMYKKKIAGEDISEDVVSLRRGLLKDADKLGIASMPTDEQFNLLMGK